jgi:glycosyltransferase involved in cell wall biosynthesis
MQASTVAVCICTFRRPAGLRHLLTCLANQTFNDIPVPKISVIVADNEGNPENRRLCNEFRQTHFQSLTYVHEHRRGISYARNACLDQVPAEIDFVAMIDDDEAPDSAWLNHLLLAQSRSGADVVVGPTYPEFQQGTPAWIKDSGFFLKPENPSRFKDLQADPPAATCNVLVNAAIFARPGLRFDPQLALSGGEDKLLFQDIKLRGYTFAWAANAKVTEFVSRERATFGYMWHEQYRRGSVKYYVKRRLKVSNRLKLIRLVPKFLARALANILAGSYGVITQLLRNRKDWSALACNALIVADGLGSISGLLHLKNRHYLRRES